MAKKIASNSFAGGIDTVTARELKPATVTEYMLNCNVLSSATGNMGVVHNVKGNTLVSVALPEGENECIGTASDEEKNQFYYAVWNSLGYHTWYRFNEIDRKITPVLQSITDTGGVDILRWERDQKILMTDVVQNNLLYWVDSIDARKINIAKCLDKTASGYGTEIKEEFIQAYKLAPDNAPAVSYASDATVNVNRFYGRLRKYASRFVYDDGERSNWSDWSNVALPKKETFTGVSTIPTDNNRMDIAVETGSRIVRQVEIAMMSTVDGGFSTWDLIITLDKEKLGILDNGLYTYEFFNDGSYPTTDQEKIIRPYSFLPKSPLVQAVTRNVMIYGNFTAGFPDVPLNVSVETAYSPLFVESGIENKFNEPELICVTNGSDFIRGSLVAPEIVVRLDGSQMKIRSGLVKDNGPRRANRHKITVGHDVKEGNEFKINGGNGYDKVNCYYKATRSDTSLTVVNQLRKQIIATGLAYLDTPDLPQTNIYDSTTDGNGDTYFEFILMASENQEYIGLRGSVQPVQYNSLKDTGESINNIKMGSTTKYGIVYEDFDGRRSLVYTDKALIVKTDTQNEQDGIKLVEHTLNIMHRPPAWAKSYQIVRTKDLTYDHYIQMLVQKVIDVPVTEEGEYQDLLVGSLFTYQKIHPNTTLAYEFKKGDRIRALKDQANNYYDYFETEILSYNHSVEDVIDSNVVIAGTDTVTVDAASADHVGKFMIIDGAEREILDAPTLTTYQLKSPIGKAAEPETLLSYKIVDRRGSVRISKPAGVTLTDNSLFEIFTPSLSGGDYGAKQFFHFNKKFPIIHAGQETRAHYGNGQHQDGTSLATLISTPAEVRISEGTTYVRNREMPLTNIIPGAQVDVDIIEDPSFSDFYFSRINNNGKVNAEDTGDGEVHFGSRLVFSNNYIEDTRINGLNDFDNLDRADYNDQYGDIKLILFKENRLYAFKELKDTWIPVNQSIMQDTNEQKVVGISSKLLNQMQYFGYEGGIGNNPESVTVNADWIYHVMPNAGVIVRIGGSGVEPLSELYGLDNEVRQYLLAASKYGAKVYAGFDRLNGVLVIAMEGYKDYLYVNSFDEDGWKRLSDELAAGTTYEIVTSPAHGTLDLTDPAQPIYIPAADYTGSDNFTYRALVDGVWSEPRKVCLTVAEREDQLAWRAKESSYVCEVDGLGIRTGYKSWTTLEQFGIFSGTLSGIEKPNVPTDFDYVAPVYDAVTCEALPVMVPISWTMSEGSGSFYDNNLLFYINSDPDYAGGYFNAGTGSFTGGYEGETITVLQDYYGGSTDPLGNVVAVWATPVTATLTLLIDGVETQTLTTLFEADQPVGNLQNLSFVLNPASTYEIVCTVVERLAVPVNWSVSYGLNPIAHNAMIFLRNGAEVARTGTEGASTLSNLFYEGDSINIIQFTYGPAYPWEAGSSANLTVDVTNALGTNERYNQDVTVQTIELQNDTFTIIAGTLSIDATSTGTSTAVGYLTKTLTVTKDTNLAEILVTDTTEPKTVLFVSADSLAGNGSPAIFPYNLKTDANTQTMRVTNTGGNSLDAVVNGGAPVTILAGTFHDFTGLAKDSITLNLTNIAP